MQTNPLEFDGFYQKIMAGFVKHKHPGTTYFKIKQGSNTSPRLNTRIVELKGFDLEFLKYVESNTKKDDGKRLQ